MLVCQPDSHFAKQYREGVHKSKYWDPTFEDAVDVCAKSARIAALVYQNHYGDASKIPDIDDSIDFSANFSN